MLDTENREVVFTYDDDGLPLTATLPDATVVGLGFDDSGNLTSVTPPGTPAHLLSYDERESLIGYTPPQPGSPPPTVGALGWDYTPDRQMDVFSADGVETVDAGYDDYGRLFELDPGVDPVGITYYPFSDGTRPGKVAEISAALDGTTIGIDYAGALVDELALTGPVAATVSWVYQTGFLVASETVAAVGGPHTVNYAYDDDRKLTQAGDLSIGYDPGSEMNGLLADTTLDLVTDTYVYNDFGELEHYQAEYDGTVNASLD